MLNANQPLGLPKGSIRAILLIIISIAIITSFFFNIELPHQVIDLWLALVALYFGLRSNFNEEKKNE